MPKLAFFFVSSRWLSIGLPGLNGFVSEFLTVLGAFTSPHLGIGYGAFAALGVILGAVYMLHMLARVLFGPLKEPRFITDPAAMRNRTRVKGQPIDRLRASGHPGAARRA
jgi:NADH-quinone oxidoreductase subunit M